MSVRLLKSSIIFLFLFLIFAIGTVEAATVTTYFCFPDADGDGFGDGAARYNGGQYAEDDQQRRYYYNQYAFSYGYSAGAYGGVPPANSLEFEFSSTVDPSEYSSLNSYSMSSVLKLLVKSNTWLNTNPYPEVFDTANPSVTCADIAAAAGISGVTSWVRYQGDSPNLQGGYDTPTCEENYDGRVESSSMVGASSIPGFTQDYYFASGQYYYINHSDHTNTGLGICNYDCDDTNAGINPGIADSAETGNVDLNCDGYYSAVNMCRPDADGDDLADGTRGFSVSTQIFDPGIAELYGTPHPSINWFDCQGNPGDPSCDLLPTEDPLVACNYATTPYNSVGSSEPQAVPNSYTSQASCEAAGYSWLSGHSPSPNPTYSSCVAFDDCSTGTQCQVPNPEATCNVIDQCQGTFACSDIFNAATCDSILGCSYDGTSCVLNASETPGQSYDYISTYLDEATSEAALNCNQYSSPGTCNPVQGCFWEQTQFSASCEYEASELVREVAPHYFDCEDYFQDAAGGCLASAPYFCQASATTCNGFSCSASTLQNLPPSGVCYQEHPFLSELLEPAFDCDDSNASRQLGCPATTCMIDNDGDGFYAQVSCNVLGSVVAPAQPPVPNDALTIPGWASTVGNSGYIWDADDNDARETYLDCPAGQVFVYPETEIVQVYTDDNDYAANLSNQQYNPKYFGGCCSSGDCLSGKVGGTGLFDPTVATNNNGLCVSSGTIENSYGYFQDNEFVCSPGDQFMGLMSPGVTTASKWLDADQSQYVCETILGYNWTASGHSENTTRLNTGNPVPYYPTAVDEYPQDKTRFECCGDDNESMVYLTCDGSSTTAPLCAPNDGNEYRIHNGDLVLASSCPDIARAPPVFLDAVYVADWTVFDNFLTTQGTGYCCDASRTNDINYPLCTHSNFEGGCFLAEQSLSLATPPPAIEWCVQTGTDENCVMDGAILGNITTCTGGESQTQNLLVNTGFRHQDFDDPTDGNNIGEVAICGRYDRTVTTTDYVGLSNSCNVADNTQGCEEITITRCTPNEAYQNANSRINPQPMQYGNCFAKCLETDTGHSNCVEYCADYTCTDTTVYVGDSCMIDAGCETTVTVTEIGVDANTVQSCDYYPSDAYKGNPNNNPIIQDGFIFMNGIVQTLLEDEPFADAQDKLLTEGITIPSEEVYMRMQTIPVVEETCTTTQYQAGTQYCLPHGFTFTRNGTEYVCGEGNDITLPQNFGDYFCPTAFITDIQTYPSDVCVPNEAVCASGPAGTVSCANIGISGNNDSYFGAYDSTCVLDTATLGVYDEACCLDVTINNIEIYGDGPTTVRVY